VGRATFCCTCNKWLHGQNLQTQFPADPSYVVADRANDG
jgi:hypothetical protein